MRPNPWMQMIPFSSSIPAAARANPKASSIPRQDISSTARRVLNGSSTTIRRGLLVHGGTQLDHRPHLWPLRTPLCGSHRPHDGRSPYHPRPDRPWEMIDKHRVNLLYTTPAFLRSCMRERIEWVRRHELSSLRILGSVGEPIGPKAWMWYYTDVGRERCPIVDTWWQTETGANLITPLPGATPLKPGSAALPFFGVEPVILRENGTECEGQRRRGTSSSGDPGRA